MAHTYRYDPEDDYGGEHLSKLSKKELKRQRKERHKREAALDQHMEPEVE